MLNPVQGLDIFKIQFFVLHNTYTISVPLFTCYFLRYNKHKKVAYMSIGYHDCNPQSLAESVVRLMYLRVYDNRDSSSNVCLPVQPSVCEAF
jgi:hypothetical protein